MHEPKTRPPAPDRGSAGARARRNALAHLLPLALLSVPFASCGGFSGSKDGEEGESGSGAEMRLEQVSNGFGQLLPHRVPALDELGNPTGSIVTIRSLTDIENHVRRENPILPTPVFQPGAVAPNGQPGNHFLVARFSQRLDPLTVLNPSPTVGGLSGGISITTLDPIGGASLPARGRTFIEGKTLVGPAIGTPAALQLVQYVEENRDPIDPRYQGLRPVPATPYGDSNLLPDPLYPEAVGFPGAGYPVSDPLGLISSNAVVFVADTDNDLAAYEPFPSGVQIRLRATTALRAANGEALIDSVLASATVGLDELPPEIITSPPPMNAPLISPGSGDVDVDPTAPVRFEFTEPVQPYSLGAMEGVEPAQNSSAVQMIFGPAAAQTAMPFVVRPVSPYDLTRFELVPGFPFPGSGPEFLSCGTFSRVDVSINADQIEDLALIESTDADTPGIFVANRNRRAATTFFETGEGPGIVNVAVAPDAILVARTGATPGMSLIDLNGFGQGTGNPTSSFPFPLEGESKFPYDPNVTQNPTIRPLLVAGDCTVDGGSAGVFTLARDSALSDLIVRAPLVSGISDMHLGHALDGTIRNSPPTGGCQAGGGNVCALDGIKVISTVLGNQPNTVAPPQAGGIQVGSPNPGYENIISWAPHPNPPRLIFPPSCVVPYIGGQEPTSVDTATNNLLVSGDPFGNPATQSPPEGLLVEEQNVFFLGPSVGQTMSANCSQYQIRQQVGHFLYVADRSRGEVVVLNSNRMTVIDRIAVPDPTSMAVSPNIDVLAVTSQLADTVSFININPSDTRFNQLVGTVLVGNSPRGIAFEPTNEDILVCNELDNTVSVIAASSLQVRRTIVSQLNRPFEVCVTPRMTNFSFQRGVYFAYIMNRSGRVALFESGPNGVNGWGFDDVIGIIPFTFQAPKTLQLDPINLDASVYIVHEGPIDVATGAPGNMGEGAISRLRMESALTGQLPLQLTGTINPNFRDASFSVPLSLGQGTGQLSGVPVDIAFDNQRNLGGIPAPSTQFSAGSPIPANGKCSVRQVQGAPRNTSEPNYLFASVPNPVGGSGVVDVLALGATGTPRQDTNPYVTGIQSIPAPQVTLLSDYFRQ